MCGIAGILTFDKGAVSDQALLRMAEQLHHRRPDESAVWVDGAIGLAHTRLPVIDLAESHQPMHSADTRWVLVFNGEIFNYRQLRQEIDYPFTTDGDTEVLLAGLVKSGISFVERLRGQFAFAAYDRLMSITHLVRDRLGVLPLHYRLDSEQLTFASEIKAVNAALPGPPAVDMDSLDAYLTSRFVPAPNTLFAMTKSWRRDAEPRWTRQEG